MQKIPTALVRDPDDRAHVINQITPGCEWVFAGEGTPTRKYDGTCTMLDDNGNWWARREVKPGKPTPPNYVPTGTDEITGKTMGWEPIEQSSFAKAFSAVEHMPDLPGTYELCGPKVNGNPEHFTHHRLVSHRFAETLSIPTDLIGIVEWLQDTEYEGIVWHHPDGRMAKLKARDVHR